MSGPKWIGESSTEDGEAAEALMDEDEGRLLVELDTTGVFVSLQGEAKIFVPASEMLLFTSTPPPNVEHELATDAIACVSYPDGESGRAAFIVQVPADKTTVSQITAHFLETLSGNYQTQVLVYHVADGEARGSDSDSETVTSSYVSSPIRRDVNYAFAYLNPSPGALQPGDLLYVSMNRVGTSGLDTYSGDLLLIGVTVTFS